MRPETRRHEYEFRALLTFAILAACLACACGKSAGEKDASAKKAPSVVGKPKIVAVERVFDFGKVKQGMSIEHVFKIRNEGDGELKIEKARGS